MALPTPKPLYFIESGWKDLKAPPGPVQDTFGTLFLGVRYGETPESAKPLKGLGGAGEKSTRGIATPKRDLDLVRRRYHSAERHHATLEQQEDRHA